jgi:hypothetical protein
VILHLQVELYALVEALMGLLQICGFDGSSGLVDDVVTSGSGGPHDPECDCREAEAPIQ